MPPMHQSKTRSCLVLLLLGALATTAAGQRRRGGGDWKTPPAPSLKGAVGEEAVLKAVSLGVRRLVDMQEADPRPDMKLRRRRGRGQRPDGTEKKEMTGKTWKAPTRGAVWPYVGVYLRGGACPPGYRVGGTAIAGWSLLEAPGFAQDKKRQAAFKRAFEFVTQQLELEPLMAEEDMLGYDVRGWGQIYALQFMLVSLKKGELDAKGMRRAKRAANQCLQLLKKQQLKGGGWNYANRGGRGGVSPFMTGPALQALMEAKAQGFEVDEATFKRGLDALESGRFEDGAYAYSGVARASKDLDKNRTGTGAPAGSAARSAVVETTLYLAGRGSIDRVRESVDMFFEHWKWLDQRMRRHSTHIGPYGIAPYYFYYAHQYTGQAIEVLPEAERAKYRDLLRRHYWLNRDKDGTWNDRVFPRSSSYGTSTSILGLMAPHMELPTPWKL